ncbi:hypothetical protein [Phytopseudomonas dryadis]|uniref:Uncharacterized protein n=1 Tax=Phytopseudomonas dryadis TaxID=2487520 RepID=A0A4Q9QTY3_9GAMM|nr:hypothetical protein [Pseudomonas dryadis]TBU86454.1 hypothetical protein DNK44_23160 [Pseudomonas dryadis]
MNEQRHSPEHDDQQVLRHVREHTRAQPSAAMDARILAAAASQRPKAAGLGERVHGWLFGSGSRGRWSAAFGCVALLGLGLGLSLKTLQDVPTTYDAPAPMLQRQVMPAPIHSAPSQESRARASNGAIPESAPLAEQATEAPKIVARMAAPQALPLSKEVLDALQDIARLRERGQDDAAAEQVEALRRRYPDLDIEAELLRLRQ